MAMVEVIPTISDELLTNPGIGFITTPGSKKVNQPLSRVSYVGVPWKDLEPRQGIYDWSILEQRLEEAGQLGCVSVVRCLPYALEEVDIPQWLRDAYPEEPEFPFWRIDPNTTPYPKYWASFITAFAKRFDGHPLICSVDMTLVGAWGEGGGTEFLSEESIETIVQAYSEGFTITPLKALLHDPISLGIIKKHHSRIGFRVDCLGDMGGFHGDHWSHMLDFYPQNIVNFGMKEAWETGPVAFEACWHMCDWYKQGWDIDYIIDESLKWHISSFNSKGTPIPKYWEKNVERWVKKMGYRYELRRIRFSETAVAGGTMDVNGLWANVGVAPIYTEYPLVLRLTQGEEIHTLESQVNIRDWLPDMDIFWEESFELPATMSSGCYEVAVGIETRIPSIGNIKLAITGEADGYYKIGTMIVQGE